MLMVPPEIMIVNYPVIKEDTEIFKRHKIPREQKWVPG